MIDYFKSMLLFFFLVLFIYIIGTAVVKDTKNMSYRFVIGYIIYSFLIAIIGLPIALLHLPWKLFMILVIVVNFLLLTFSLLRIFKYKIEMFPKGILKNNWCLFLITGMILLTSLAYIKFYWEGNCSDDGFYINKMEILPHVEDPFKVTPATGLLGSSFNLYLLNTGEMEASVYIYLFNINANVYARLFLAAFNYFLLINVICAFVYKLYEKKQWKFDKGLLQYVPIIIILFGFEYTYLSSNRILTVTDSWQFTTAMYYGSSIVKTMGIMLLLLPVIDKEKIGIKNIIFYIMTSVVLVSKSTIAIPLIFLVGISYLLVYFFTKKTTRLKILSISILFLLFIISMILKDQVAFQNELYKHIKFNFQSIFFILSFIAFNSGFFLGKETTKINMIVLIIAALMLINPFNNVFENLSTYSFVAARMLTLLIYTIVILGYMYTNIYIYKFVKNKYYITFLSLIIMAFLVGMSIVSYTEKYGSIIKGYKILYHNQYFIPDSTLQLGNKLQKIYDEEKKDINVLVSEGAVNVDGYQHSLAVLIRTNAPNVNIITASTRYGTGIKNPFVNYTKKDTNVYYAFMVNPNKKTFNNFKKLLKTYPINCVVLNSDDKNGYMTKLGYKLYDKVIDGDNGIGYYIYYNDGVEV